MSKGTKRSKSSVAPVSGARWEQGILCGMFEEEKWKPNVTFLVGNKVDDYKHVALLTAAVNSGIRKLFNVVTKESLFNEVQELGNPKLKKTKDVPSNYEICEPCKSFLDAGEEIPGPLLAKLIKYRLMAVKTADQERRGVEKKGTQGKGGGAGKARAKSSPKRGGGKKTPDSQGGKPESKLKKRGEDDKEIKSIDDEPEDGAQHYFILTGFNDPRLLHYLSDIGVNVNCVLRVFSQDYSRLTSPPRTDPPTPEKNEKTQLAEDAAREERRKLALELQVFWENILPLLRNNPHSSRLHDVARLDYEVKNWLLPTSIDDAAQKAQFGTAIFDDIASMIYDLQDARRLYYTYLQNLKIQPVPTCAHVLFDKLTESPPTGATFTPTAPAATAAQVGQSSGGSTTVENLSSMSEMVGPPDMRYYNDLMSCLPLESVSVPLVLHCMLEQVVASQENRGPPSELSLPARPDGLNLQLAEHLANAVFKLSLTEEEQKAFSEGLSLPMKPPEDPKPQLLLNGLNKIVSHTHHLKPVYGFHPEEIEMSMLKFFPLAEKCHTLRPQSAEVRERAARLHELICFCSANGLSLPEIDRAFKQFVFESMDLATTDPNGFLVRRDIEGLMHTVIPWDDPYPFFKGMIPTEKRFDAPILVDPEESTDSEAEFSPPTTPSPPLGADHASYRPSRPTPQSDLDNLHQLQAAVSPIKDEVMEESKVNIERVSRASISGRVSISHSGSATSRKGILRSRSNSASPHWSRSRSGSCVHFEVPSDHHLEHEVASDTAIDQEESKEKSLDDTMEEVIVAQKRVLDQWCFAEHFDREVLLQVLREALYVLPFVETYNHRRDQTLMLVLHNPYSKELKNHVDWHVELHSNLGFRNYLDYVVESIGSWLKIKEAEHQAKLLSSEVEKMVKEETEPAQEKKGKPDRSLSKSGSKSSKGTGSRTSSDETSSRSSNIYIRQGSIKAWKAEQEQIRAEEEAKTAEKKDKAPKSAGKKKEKELKDKEEGSSCTPSSKSKASFKESEESPPEEKTETSRGEEPFWQFMGYDTKNMLLNISGITTTLFPADGGQIRSERTDFAQGTTAIRTTLLKDGHIFTVHLLNPLEETEEPPDPDIDPPLDQKQKEGGKEDSKQDGNDTSDSPGDREMAEDEKKPKPFSQFGSITACLSDGMIFSLSQWGATGCTEQEKKKLLELTPSAPSGESSSTPQPQAAQQQGSSSPKGKKEKEKLGKTRSTPEPSPVVEEEKVEEKVQEETPPAPPPQPFQELYITCPDGLHVRYFLESSAGVVPESDDDRQLVIKQFYPIRTSGVQNCEAARLKTISNEVSRIITGAGTVIKTMMDGSVQVLYADGMVAVHSGPWPRPLSRASSPTSKSSARSQAGDQDTPTKKVGRSSSKGLGRGSEKAIEQISTTNVEQEIEKPGVWTFTYPDGSRVQTSSFGTQEELPPVLICLATDPDTKQTMATRDDNVITVSYPDGTTVVEHSDGTRITQYYRDTQVAVGGDGVEDGVEDGGEDAERQEEGELVTQTLKFMKVECPAYATVEFNCETTESLTVFGTGTTVNVFPDGYYILHHAHGGRVEVDTEGTLVYYPRHKRNMEQLQPEREQQYTLRHNAAVICETVDPDGNVFTVKHTGDFAVLTSAPGSEEALEISDDTRLVQQPPVSEVEEGNRGVKLVRYKQHAPRFFLIHADGGGTELHRYQDISEYLTSAERDLATAVLKEPIPEYPGMLGITVLKPHLGGPSERWLKKYDEQTIVPRGIRCRDLTTLSPYKYKTPRTPLGHKAGRGLSLGSTVKVQEAVPILKCPQALELRQLVQYKPVSQALRTQLQQCMREYAEVVVDRNRKREKMAVRDPRSEDEKILANDLLNKALEEKVHKSFVDPECVKELYEKAVAPLPPSPPPTPQPKRTQADWERDQRELAEEMNSLSMLRQKKVTGYFDSEMGKAFLLTQAKDMDEMLKELSEDPRHDGTEAILADPTKFAQPSSGLSENSPSVSRQQQQSAAASWSATSDPLDSGSRYRVIPDTPLSYQGWASSDFGVPSSSTLRPGNPTPGQGAGQGSPAPVRPTSPTPDHAAKVMRAERPINPTPKKARGMVETFPEADGSKVKGDYPMILEQPAEEEKEEDAQHIEIEAVATPARWRLNIAGNPRSLPVPLPSSLMGGRPGAQSNLRHRYIEDPVRRQVRNTAAKGVTQGAVTRLSSLRGLNLLPEEVDFGVLREGCTYLFVVFLKNTGVDSCRFNVRQPPPGTGLRVFYKPGPVAAGMKVDLRLELYAIAVGVIGGEGVGTVSHNLEITTETDIMQLPVTATVITAYDYDERVARGWKEGPASGVILLSDKPPGTVGIIKPRREIACSS